jgi:hypothetical protein
VNETGDSLVDIANNLPVQEEVPVETHTDRMGETLLPLWQHLDNSILALGSEVSRYLRMRWFQVLRQAALCDVTVHNDHLSVYVPSGAREQKLEAQWRNG